MNQLEANQILDRQKAKAMNNIRNIEADKLEEGMEIMLAGRSRIIEAILPGVRGTIELHTTEGVFRTHPKRWIKVYS